MLFDSGMRPIGALCYCLAVCLWFCHLLAASRCALLVTCGKSVVFVKVTFKMKLNTFSPNHKNRKIKNILFCNDCISDTLKIMEGTAVVVIVW